MRRFRLNPRYPHHRSDGTHSRRAARRMARLVQVPAASLPVLLACQSCHARLKVPPDAAFADLDGAPFQAYLCVKCAQNARAEANR